MRFTGMIGVLLFAIVALPAQASKKASLVLGNIALETSSRFA